MAPDIEGLVKSCSHCAQTAASPIKVPLAPWPDPGKPWVRVHLDFAEPQKGNSFIVVVDAFSKYVDAAFLKPSTSYELVKYLHVVFRLFGTPETIVTDNGPQFVSAEFAELCSSFNIIHLRSSPYHPQSNGQAEKMVGTLKRSLEFPDEASLDKAVAAYNYTPNQVLDGKTPAEIFFGRSLRSPFAVFRSRSDAIPQCAEKFKAVFDKHFGVRSRSFARGEEVVVGLNKKRRVPAVFMERVGKAMAHVEVNGKVVRRHLNQLWKRRVLPAQAEDEEEFLPGSQEVLPTADVSEAFDSASSGSSAQSQPSETSPVSPATLAESPSADPTPASRIQPGRAAKKPTDYSVLAGLRRLWPQSN
ncbi:uncharacterized protein K02A2.6-like [Galendromus occidentalis]|uniref:Uncharacterized protein K02A2.6-like n=1 Tax=Galendromus occidentalis TaxID=34638 RepID=A0AAJ6VWL9_9ACAR|nr:uncharacterized protein K02A2.6-like [Galendromus occidentalis]